MGDLVKWMDVHQGGAAWVQGIGAVIAIFLTIVLNRADARERRTEQRARVRNSAIFVRPYFRNARDRVSWALEQKQAGSRPDYFGTDDEGNEMRLDHSTRVRPEFSGAFPVFAELGPASASAQDAFRSLVETNELISSLSYTDGPPDEVSYAITKHGEIWAQAERAFVALENAMEDIDRLIAPKTPHRAVTWLRCTFRRGVSYAAAKCRAAQG